MYDILIKQINNQEIEEENLWWEVCWFESLNTTGVSAYVHHGFTIRTTRLAVSTAQQFFSSGHVRYYSQKLLMAPKTFLTQTAMQK